MYSDDERTVLLMVRLSQRELAKLQTAIVVEGWHHVVGRRSAGRQRRAYLAQFNEKERKIASRLHTKFYGWHMRTGMPQSTLMSIRTIDFIRKLVAFFGTI